MIMNNQNPLAKNYAKIILLVLMVASSGCATKHYGRMTTLSGMEKSAYDCKNIEIEIAKCEEFINQVENESSLDGRSVLSFLGDYGIGNKMEKDDAMKSARERLSALKALKYEKHCGEYSRKR
jgi:hypothetical protein